MLIKKTKDISFRSMYFKTELKSKLLKFLFIYFSCKPSYFVANKKKRLLLSFLFLVRKLQQVSKTKMQRRCVLTNRSRGIIRFYGISRIKLKELLSFGIIPGYKKAVW
jgi:ribosomal protein S14